MIVLREDRPATIDERRALLDTIKRYRNALMWVFDYFSMTDMTEKERIRGLKQIANVLTDRPSRAATYVPNDWDDSAKLAIGDRGDRD